MSDEAAARDRDADAWLRSPHTRRLIENVRKQAETQLDGLLRICGSSTDPNVRSAKERYDGLLRTLLVLEKGTT